MKKENIIEIQKPVTITQKDEIITLEKGDRIKIVEKMNRDQMIQALIDRGVIDNYKELSSMDDDEVEDFYNREMNR